MAERSSSRVELATNMEYLMVLPERLVRIDREAFESNLIDEKCETREDRTTKVE